MPRLRSAGRNRPSEFEAIELLAKQLAQRGPGVRLGIGDDAALLERVRGKLVLSVDTCLEHTHFELEWLSLEQLGARAMHSAASDLAAMGARAVAALSALVLPENVTTSQLGALARGQAKAAQQLGCVVVGGNLARGRDFCLTTTVIGSALAPIRRRGAKPGDQLWLLGEVGLAAAGLRLLQAGRRHPRKAAQRRCVDAWRAPRALVKEGLALVGRASAAIDISDGLCQDAAHIARASSCRIVIDADALERRLAPELIASAKALGLSPLELALGGGEDYALLATGSAAHRQRGVKPIGRVERGAGVVVERANGTRVETTAGFDHFKNA